MSDEDSGLSLKSMYYIGIARTRSCAGRGRMLGDHSSSGGLIKTNDSSKSKGRHIKEDLADKVAKAGLPRTDLSQNFSQLGIGLQLNVAPDTRSP